MPSKKSPLTPAQLAAALVRGLKGAEVVHRHIEKEGADSHLVKVEKRVVAQVLVRRRGFVRVNLKVALAGVQFPGEATASRNGHGHGDKTWPGGAFIATEDFLADARRVLEAAVVAASEEQS